MLGHVLEEEDRVPGERLRRACLGQTREQCELLERGGAGSELLLALVGLGARVGEEGEQGAEGVDRLVRKRDRHPGRACGLVEREDVVPRLGNAHAEAIEQVGPVGADVPGGVDREPPQAPLPLVARVARADGASGLVGDEVAVEQVVERKQRSGGDDLPEVWMVEDEQVVLLCQLGDRRIGERL